MTTTVPGQMGPHYTLSDKHCAEALKAILEKDGAANLVSELYHLMRKRKVDDIAEIFDAKNAGMVFGPASVVRSLKSAVEWGQAENYTMHFAITAIVYAMALEKLDPDFFEEKKHAPPQDPAGYEKMRQEIMEYVRVLNAREPP
jgi:hypothetical protein